MSSDRETTLRDAVIAFLAKWPDAKKAIDSVCLIAHVHGAGYSGPTLGVEIEAMQAALASTPPASVLQARINELQQAIAALSSPSTPEPSPAADDEQTIRDIAKSLDVSPQELTAYALESVGAPASVPVEPSGCVWKKRGEHFVGKEPRAWATPDTVYGWKFCPYCALPLSLVSEDA